jgi:hypothetical protein
MIQAGVVHHLQVRMNGTCLRVIGAVDQAADAGMNRRSRTHYARLNCSKQFAVAESVITEVSSRFTQRHDFGVRGGIVLCDIAIPASSDHAAVADHDRSHRHFVDLEGALRAAESFFHPKLVG